MRNKAIDDMVYHLTDLIQSLSMGRSSGIINQDREKFTISFRAAVRSEILAQLQGGDLDHDIRDLLACNALTDLINDAPRQSKAKPEAIERAVLFLLQRLRQITAERPENPDVPGTDPAVAKEKDQHEDYCHIEHP